MAVQDVTIPDTDPDTDGPVPASTDRTAPGARTERRRGSVESLVQRSLEPAFGLCVRAFDPIGTSPEWRERARRIVMAATARAAVRSKGRSADDDTVRDLMARVAETSLDELMDHPGSAPPPDDVDLEKLLPDGFPMADMAPGGNLPYVVLQDAVAAARRIDRRVAFVVLAAGVPARGAAVLLGVPEAAVRASLERIAGRLADIHGTSDAADQ